METRMRKKVQKKPVACTFCYSAQHKKAAIGNVMYQ